MSTSPVAIVTGGGAGIGSAISARLARDGAAVAVADLDKERAKAVADQLVRVGSRARAYGVDVSESREVEALVERTRADLGPVEILVNNAGIVRDGPLLDLPEEVWDQTLAVNLKGTFLCTQAVARAMIADGVAGRIVNISSVQGVTVWPSVPHAPYEVSKAGIIMLTRQSAFELAPHGIRVTCAAPGPVATEILRPWTSDPKRLESITERIPLGRVAEPEEVAGVVAFLVGPDASYLTGVTVFIDGGRMTW